jgi:hypothetical protein
MENLPPDGRLVPCIMGSPYGGYVLMTEYTPWGELTDEAKGYLLLFRNRGGTIQRWWEGTHSWEDTQHPDWVEDHYYRIKLN